MSKPKGRIPPKIPITPKPQIDKKQRLNNQLQQIQDKFIENLNIFDQQNSQSQSNGISPNKLSISPNKIPYFSEQETLTKEQQKYEQILKKKQKKQLELEKIRKIEEEYSKRIGNSRMENSSSDSRMSRLKSQQHLEEMKKIKKIKKRYDMFEKSLQEKTLKYEENKMKSILEQKRERQQELEMKNSVKKTEISKKLHELQALTQGRQAKNKIQTQKLKQIAQKRKLFEILDKSWQQKKISQQKHDYELMEERLKKKNQFDFKQLKEHQKKYEEIIKERKKQFQEKRFQLSRMSNNNSYLDSLEKSKYYTMVIKQDRKIRFQEKKKQKEAKKLQQKKMQYVEYVKQQFMPRVKSQNDSNDEDDDRKKNGRYKIGNYEEKQIVRLTQEQIKQMGNRNFIQAKSKMKKKRTDSHQQQSKEIQNKYNTIQVYPDYLSELRKKHEQAEKTRKNKAPNKSAKKQAEKILMDSKMPKQQKIQKIKLLAEKVNANAKNDMISQIMGKLQILELIN